jgi:hypothetical protein
MAEQDPFHQQLCAIGLAPTIMHRVRLRFLSLFSPHDTFLLSSAALHLT